LRSPGRSRCRRCAAAVALEAASIAGGIALAWIIAATPVRCRRGRRRHTLAPSHLRGRASRSPADALVQVATHTVGHI
jgi:hypothetical protein